jgi:hypothetical protein
MFNKFVEAFKTFFSAKPVSLQFEEMLLQEAVQKIKDEDAAREKVAPVIIDAVPTHGSHSVPVTEPAKKPKKPAAKKPAAKKPAAKKPAAKKPNIKIVK